MPGNDDGAITALLARIDDRLTELRDLVIEQRTVQEKYSTAEAAKLLGRTAFTVRGCDR